MPSSSRDWSFESFYRSFTPVEQFGPMADLMAPLQVELQRRGLTAFTSHATFCISRHPAYPEWYENALVRISPHHTGRAQLVFDEGGEDWADDQPTLDFRDRGELVPYATLLDRIQLLLDRL